MKFLIGFLLLFCVGCVDIDLSEPMEVMEITEYAHNICDYEIYDNNGRGKDTLRAQCGMANSGQFIMIANKTIEIVDKPSYWRR